MQIGDWFAYHYVEGIFFPEFIEKAGKGNIKKVIKDVFGQMRVMDEKKINKEEMHHPYKHIIVKDNKAVLIDFERTRLIEKPQNVTQFCQYLISRGISDVLKKKGFRIDRRKVMSAAGRYKKRMNEENFRAILNLF